MSLQAWLPFNSSIINCGLSGTTPTNSGTLMYSSGLFGSKCLNSGDSTVTIPVNSSDVMSFSLWFKGTSPSDYATLISLGEYDNRISILNGSYYWYLDGNSAPLINYSTLLFSVTDLTWNNLIVVIDGTNVKFYINGELRCTAAQNNNLSTVFGNDLNIYIGSKSDSSGSWDGLIQDLKIYNHTLSKKEIVEINKGLLINYTFNHHGFGNKNLMINSTFATTTGTTTSTSERFESDIMYADLEAGTYTLSADLDVGTWASSNYPSGVSDPENNYIGLELYQKNGDNVSTRTWYDMTSGHSEVSITTSGRYYLGFIVYSDGITECSASFSKVKLEKGTKATTWVPEDTSEEYSILNIDDQEPDCSGNKLYASFNTIPLWTSDTARYSGSYDFSNGGQIVSPVLDLSNISKTTVSVWAKNLSENEILFGFNNGSKFNFSTVGGVFGIYSEDTASNIPFGEGTSIDNYVDAWHHYLITSDGESNTLYIDGNLIGSTSTYVGFGSGTLYISGWNTVNNKRFTGLMSDFKVFIKVLNSNEIKNEYSTKIAIDKEGNIFIGEIEGMNSGIALSKNSKLTMDIKTVYTSPFTVDEITTNSSYSTVYNVIDNLVNNMYIGYSVGLYIQQGTYQNINAGFYYDTSGVTSNLSAASLNNIGNYKQLSDITSLNTDIMDSRYCEVLLGTGDIPNVGENYSFTFEKEGFVVTSCTEGLGNVHSNNSYFRLYHVNAGQSLLQSDIVTNYTTNTASWMIYYTLNNDLESVNIYDKLYIKSETSMAADIIEI